MILTAVLLLAIQGSAAEQPRFAALTASLPASAPANEPAPPDEWRVNVATLNIYFENRSPDLAVKAIRESKADVVFLQETTARIEQHLRKELKDLYPYTVFKGGSGKLPTDRFGILARRPIEKTRFLPPRSGLFGTLIAQTTIDGRRLQLVNVHLKPLRLQPNARPAQHLQAMRALDKAHTAELGFILKSIDPKLTTIIAGDFNSIPQSAGPRLLAEKGFVDAFKPPSTNPAESEADSGPTTWQFETRLGPIRLRIDYIFCSKDLAAVDGKVIPDTGSDHALVVAEIGLPKDETSTHPATKAGP